MSALNPMMLTRRALMALAAAALLWSTTPAAAQDIDGLRAAGAVAERYDGYVMVRDASVAGAQAVVDQINAQRRSIYEARAAEEGVTAEQIGMVYSGQIIQQAPAGTWFLNADGSWIQK